MDGDKSIALSYEDNLGQYNADLVSLETSKKVKSAAGALLLASPFTAIAGGIILAKAATNYDEGVAKS